MNHIVPAMAALILSFGLGACSASGIGASESTVRRCDAEAARALAGRSSVSEDEAKTLTDAATIRRISPGDMVTMDFRQDRLTLEVDAKGVIVRAACG